MPDTYNLEYFSCIGGIVSSSQKVKTQTRPFKEMNSKGVLLIPGGMGTRILVDNANFIRRLALVAKPASYVLTVCTGSALLAKTGLLDARKATSNKRAFEWVQSISDTVIWIKQARWVVDGRFYTSSGVSAGMDMTLGFIADLHGLETAQNVTHAIEYVWNSDKSIDPFAR